MGVHYMPNSQFPRMIERTRCTNPTDFGYDLATLEKHGVNGDRAAMIRNGLYAISTKLLDGVDGGQTGVSVLRNGRMLWGGAVLYHFGSYHCSGSKWQGEVTSQEHTPTIDVR